MSLTLIIAIAAGTAGVGLMIASNMILVYMKGQVNATLPEADRIPVAFANQRHGELMRYHRLLFPSSKLPVAMTSLGIVGLVFFAGAFVIGVIANSSGAH
jgi:hypothetical protein